MLWLVKLILFRVIIPVMRLLAVILGTCLLVFVCISVSRREGDTGIWLNGFQSQM